MPDQVLTPFHQKVLKIFASLEESRAFYFTGTMAHGILGNAGEYPLACGFFIDRFRCYVESAVLPRENVPFRIDRKGPERVDLAQSAEDAALVDQRLEIDNTELSVSERNPNAVVTVMPGASRADRAMWDAFHDNWNEMSDKSEIAFDQLMEKDVSASDKQISVPTGESETTATLKVRRHQQFFRNTVLASYEQRCALSLIAVPALLNASHIIPWSVAEGRRTDPTNGICLNALYDRAFDRGLITFDKDLRLLVSSLLKTAEIPEFQKINFSAIEGNPIHLPHRFTPDPSALEHHREHIFSD